MTIRRHLTAIFGLLWIGCCALALVMQSRLMFRLPFTLTWLDGFVFGSTVFGYHFAHRRLAYRAVAWLLGGMGGLCFFWLDRTTQLLALGPVCLWGAYYGLQRPDRSGLRRSPIAKPIVIALAWAWVTVWLPTHQLLWPFFVARAAFIFALALAYDLADLSYDQGRHFTTLVGHLGVRRAQLLLDAGLALAAGCVGLGLMQQNISLAVALAMWTTYLLTSLILRHLLQSTLPVIAQKAVVDGMMVLQALVVWLLAR